MFGVSLIRKRVLRMVMKILRKSTAVLMAIVCLAFGIIAYADSSFSPVYSGRLVSTNPERYMEVSDSDAAMHRIIYKDTAGFRFLTISKPTSFIFSKDYLCASYSKNAGGYFSDSDGTPILTIEKEIIIESRDVKATLFFAWITGITVTYEGIEYST